MKVALICPTNTEFMPYLNYYIDFFKLYNIEVTLFVWNRFRKENIIANEVFNDKKEGVRRNFFDYYEYTRFVKKRILESEYDRIVVFGLQMTFFLGNVLMKKYKNKYIVDIRDYNLIFRLRNFRQIFKRAFGIVISSPGYKTWLPKKINYIICHNVSINDLTDLEIRSNQSRNRPLRISYIGLIRDYKANLELIRYLGNNINYDIYFHGYMDPDNPLIRFVLKNEIRNVFFTGKYEMNDEPKLYLDSDFISILLPNSDINSRTLLPNRLYKAALFGKPILTLSGTYFSRIVSEYNLGVIFDKSNFSSTDLLVEKINQVCLNENQARFIKDIYSVNLNYINLLKKFINVG